MEKHSKIKSYAPKGKSVVKKEKKTKEPKIVRGFFDDEPYEYGKGGGLKSIAKKYEENEDENAHSENVVLLAKHFGTKEDLAEAKQILLTHNRQGHLSSENGAKRRELHLKLIAKAREEMKKEGIAFAKGGMLEHGLRQNDTIKSGGGIGKTKTTIRVHNSNSGDFRVDLDKGKRTELKYNSKTKKYEDKMAKGGMTYIPLGSQVVISSNVQDYIDEGYKTNSIVEVVGVDDDGYLHLEDKKGKQYYAPPKDVMLRKSGDGSFEKEIAKQSKKAKADIQKLRNEMAKGGYMKKGGQTEEKPKTPKGKKTKTKEPQVVRYYFEDEAFEYGDGGAIYVGDKVKIKGSNKTMVVKNIQKGKKGYVEFSGDGGTYLKGDLEKYAKGGNTKVNLGSGEMDLEDAIEMYENKIKSQGRITNERDENMLKQLKSMRPKMARGGSISSWNYEIGGL